MELAAAAMGTTTERAGCVEVRRDRGGRREGFRIKREKRFEASRGETCSHLLHGASNKANPRPHVEHVKRVTNCYSCKRSCA